MAKKTVPIIAVVEPELAERLDALARRCGRPKSHVIRYYLEQASEATLPREWLFGAEIERRAGAGGRDGRCPT